MKSYNPSTFQIYTVPLPKKRVYNQCNAWGWGYKKWTSYSYRQLQLLPNTSSDAHCVFGPRLKLSKATGHALGVLCMQKERAHRSMYGHNKQQVFKEEQLFLLV